VRQANRDRPAVHTTRLYPPGKAKALAGEVSKEETGPVRQPFSGPTDAAVTQRRFHSRLTLSLGVGFHGRIVGHVDPDVDVRLAAEVPDE
jgi:hypothetical protein